MVQQIHQDQILAPQAHVLLLPMLHLLLVLPARRMTALLAMGQLLELVMTPVTITRDATLMDLVGGVQLLLQALALQQTPTPDVIHLIQSVMLAHQYANVAPTLVPHMALRTFVQVQMEVL